ncbi:MAG: hypothetical protein ACLFP2_04225 [Candidatus Woesearchaeota archaeon]
MDLSLHPSSLGTKCRDLIIFALSKRKNLGAKKLFRYLQEEFSIHYSYQAVHKALKKMEREGIVKCYEREYYINPEWREYLNSFLGCLKEKGEINEKHNAVPVDYCLQQLESTAHRFIPFFMEARHVSGFKKDNEGKNHVTLMDERGNEMRY